MLDSSAIISLLQENDTFATVPPETLEALAECASERTCESGEFLIEQGGLCSELFIAIQGTFAVIRFNQKTETKSEVARLGHGHIFGEIAAVSGIGATASVQAVEAGSVLVIPGDHLHKVMSKSPSLAESLLLSLSRYMK